MREVAQNLLRLILIWIAIEITSNYSVTNKEYYIEPHKRQGSRSRGKREKLINYPAKSFVKATNVFLNKKRFTGAVGPSVKKMSFKSFDQRRALTKLDHRDASLEESSNYMYNNPLRSSSACHKKSFSNERNSSAHKKSAKAGRPSLISHPILVKVDSHRQKKIKQRSQLHGMKRVSATQAMLSMIKSCKNK